MKEFQQDPFPRLKEMEVQLLFVRAHLNKECIVSDVVNLRISYKEG